MRGIWLLLPALAVISGCGDSSHLALTATALPVAKVEALTAPDSLLPGSLGLIGAQDRLISLGETPDEVSKVFPPVPGAAEFRELPPRFQAPYTAKGWENGSGGFGAIFYDAHLAQATHREVNLTLVQVYNTVKQYEAEFGRESTEIPGMRVKYWFWEDRSGNPRLMICALQNRKDPKRFDLTTAFGDVKVLDALRMSPAAAREDRMTFEGSPDTAVHPG